MISPASNIFWRGGNPPQPPPHCLLFVCRRQYNEIYFRELFLAAHFSRKFEKPSDKVPTVHFLLCDYRTFRNRNLPRLVHTSKIVLYSIYVIMYVRGNSIGTDRTDHTGPPFKSFYYYKPRGASPGREDGISTNNLVLNILWCRVGKYWKRGGALRGLRINREILILRKPLILK